MKCFLFHFYPASHVIFLNYTLTNTIFFCQTSRHFSVVDCVFTSNKLQRMLPLFCIYLIQLCMLLPVCSQQKRGLKK